MQTSRSIRAGLAAAALSLVVAAPAVAGTPAPGAGAPVSPASLPRHLKPPAKAFAKLPKRVRHALRHHRAGAAHSAGVTSITTGISSCSASLDGYQMNTGAPTVTGSGSADWFYYYNAVAYWDGSGWPVDSNTWFGPIWGSTAYPGWFYVNGAWSNDWPSAGATISTVGAGGYWVGVQWVHTYYGNQTVYQYTQTIGSDEYVPGRGYCIS